MAAATAFQYCSWETNKVIMEELLRNLCLAMVAVFIMTLILLANLVASCFVLISVTLTLVSIFSVTYVQGFNSLYIFKQCHVL